MSTLPDALSSVEGRWFDDLVEPVQGMVRAAWRRLPVEVDPLAPRTGLGGALVIHIARGYGRARWQESSRVATALVEAANQLMWHPDAPPPTLPGADRMAKWIRPLLQIRGRVERVLDRLGDVPDSLGDEEVPEGVIFFRYVVAAGVLAGDVPDSVHGTLDRWATWMGLAWEHAQGTLSPQGWRGGLLSVGLEVRPFAPAGALRELRAALAELPDGHPTEHLLPLSPTEEPGERRFTAYRPHKTPVPRPGHDHPVERVLAEIVHSASPAVGDAVVWLQHQGGKRMRPRLVLAAARAVGGDPEDALRPAAIVEWIHQASLLVDDILDEASLRRGGPTLHVAADIPFALAVAAWILHRLRLAAADLPEAMDEALLDAAIALLTGEHAELLHTGVRAVDRTAYYRIIEQKTARLFRCAVALGGLSGGASRPQLAALDRFGHQVGLAFQIIDDTLDYLGDARSLGKEPGTDFRARKTTLPLLELAERPDFDADLAEVTAQMQAEDVRSRCLERARLHLGHALKALDAPPGDGRDELAAIARAAVERTR